MGRSEEGEGHVQIYTHDSRHRLLQQVGSCRPFVENKQMPENKERTQALSLYLRKAGQWKGERTMKANRKGAGGHANVGSGRAGLPSLVRLYYLVFVIELITKTVGHLRQFDIRETDIIIQSVSAERTVLVANERFFSLPETRLRLLCYFSIRLSFSAQI